MNINIRALLSLSIIFVSLKAEDILESQLTPSINATIESFFDGVNYSNKENLKSICIDMVKKEYATYKNGQILYDRAIIRRAVINRVIANVQTKACDLAREIAAQDYRYKNPEDVSRAVLNVGNSIKNCLENRCMFTGDHVGALKHCVNPNSDLYYRVRDLLATELSKNYNPTPNYSNSTYNNRGCSAGCGTTDSYNIKLLPCGHGICVSCAEQWYDSRVSNGKLFNCPNCKAEYSRTRLDEVLYGTGQSFWTGFFYAVDKFFNQ